MLDIVIYLTIFLGCMWLIGAMLDGQAGGRAMVKGALSVVTWVSWAGIGVLLFFIYLWQKR